jgi:sensor histidine kinase YesM/ligand-binding sensor domain-containing protein
LNTTKLFLLCSVLTGCFFKSSGQQYSYKHYDIKDGLAGNNVYHAVIDRDNFLWFCTETGVSRFDGTHFKNFTTADGLPDNEILKMFVDSRGRVWMAPFKNEISYYSKGKIHNTKNDTVLSRLQLTANVVSISESGDGDIVLLNNSEIAIIRPNGKTSYLKAQNEYLHNFFTPVATGTNSAGNIFLFLGESVGYLTSTKHLYKLSILPDTFAINREQPVLNFIGGTTNTVYIKNNLFIYPDDDSRSAATQVNIYNVISKKNIVIPSPKGLNWISILNDSIIYLNTKTGVIEFNCNKREVISRYLEGQSITAAFKDSEGYLWFTTPENGIWRLNSREMKNTGFTDNEGFKQVFSLIQSGSLIVAGSSGEQLYTFNPLTGGERKSLTLKSNNSKKIVKIMIENERLYCLTEDALYSSSLALDDIRKLTTGIQTIHAFKDMDIRKEAGGIIKVVIATHALTLFIQIKDRENTLLDGFNGRATSVCFADKGVYVGTLAGLKYADSANNVTYLADTDPLLANRITKLLYAKNKLWIGTNDNGVVCFDGKKVIKNISAKEGLTGNIVRAMYADGDYLWVGTDRGLNKINIADTTCPVVMRYTTADGLASDMIHAVFVNDDKVYVGTPRGVTFFDEKKVANDSRCDLRILGITVSGKERQYDSSKLFLAHKNNNIRFDFVGLSYKSAGDIIYSYKLSGIDDDWKTTKENFLQYPTLPSGSYELLLQATNKFGVKSDIITLRFEIAQTIAEKSWFRILVLAAALGLTWWLASLRTKRIRTREREKAATSGRIAELEQQALKAQMNPHFIFNCLNSIQQYVFDKDVAGANKFITGFSRLIRQTMENSSKHKVSAAEEEAYLNTYLALEKNRFEDKFDYSITIDEKIQKDEVFLPPMLLQPFIENSIRHGIRLKQNGKGLIEINISLDVNDLICTIIDNGAGRAAAQAFKSSQHIEYQSRGMQLTSQRIDLLNKNTRHAIALKVEDLADSGIPCGTKVTITLPLQNTGRKQ